MSDRRDRDELTDRDDLAALIMGDVPFEEDYDTFHNEALRIADAILAAGWVHWPHDCAAEAELILTEENYRLQELAAFWENQTIKAAAENATHPPARGHGMTEPYFHHGITGLNMIDPEPCPHDCAVGIGTVSTSTPQWSGAIWECTVCHVIGEDAPDGTVVWDRS